jgi:transposase InsO family protein
LDDIAIFSDSVEDHKRNVRKILDRLREHGVTASAKKTILFADELEFLGHVISNKGIRPHPSKIEKIIKWPDLRNTGDVLSFNGLAEYVANFVPALASSIQILSRLTKKNVVFAWNKEEKEAFERIKQLMKETPFLKPIDDSDNAPPIWLISDASDRGIGGVLCQGHDWKTAVPAGFYSRSLTMAERNYPTHDKEMLAIVECLKKWTVHLTDVTFTVLTDHKPLTYWMTQKNLSRRQARWLDLLAEFNFKIDYIPGIVNRAADGLSRYPHWHLEPAAIQVSEISISNWEKKMLDLLKTSYSNDTFFAPIMENPEQFQAYNVKDGLLYLSDGRLCIPDEKTLRQKLLMEQHDQHNHFGYDKTYIALRNRYFWPGLAKNLKEYIQSCQSCASNKSRTHAQFGYQKMLPIPSGRFKEIALDFVGPLKMSRGKDMLLVITDRFTGWVEAHAITQKTSAPEIANIMFTNWYSTFGIPKILISDRDSKFNSQFWKELHRRIGSQIRMSTSFHPQTDGSSERSNKTIIEALRHYVNKRQDDWTDHLPRVIASMNRSVSATTGYSPYELVFGEPPPLWNLPEDSEERVPEVKEFLDNIQNSVIIAKDNLTVARTRQAIYKNKKRIISPIFNPGDYVWLNTKNIRTKIKGKGKNKVSTKFLPRYIKATVEKAYPETDNYELTDLPSVLSKIHKRFHASLIEPYNDWDSDQFPLPRKSTHAALPDLPADEDDDVYEVEKILRHRKSGKRTQYLVKWNGYPSSENRWIVEDDFVKPNEHLEKYWSEQKGGRV